MNYITEKKLQHLIDYLNDLCGYDQTPLTTIKKDNGDYKCLAIPNVYHLDKAYGGYKLIQNVNKGGGVREITHTRSTKKDLFNKIKWLIKGFELGMVKESCKKGNCNASK